MNEKVAILIPTVGINFERALKPCLQSLIKNTDLTSGNVKIYLIINGMKEKTYADFNFFFNTEIDPLDKNSSVIPFTEDKPLGYVGAINKGLDYVFSKEDKADYVVFLNDDVQILNDKWLDLLLDPFRKNPKMGLVGAKSLPCPVTGEPFPLGFCVMTKREVFEQIGMLDPIWGIGYGDDIDFYHRARKAGFDVYSYIYINRGTFPISHEGESTMHSEELFTIKEWDKHTARNRDLLQKRYGRKTEKVPFEKRMDLREQHDSVFDEVIKRNAYRVTDEDFRGKNIIDVGANNGLFSLWAREKGAEKIISVEPNPATYQILAQNAAGLNITTLERAIGKKDGEHVQVIRRSEFGEIDGRTYVIPSESGTETISLDTLVKMFEDDKPILLKCDCEGGEYDLFYGASQEALNRVQTICMEMHENIYRTEGQTGLIEKLRTFLQENGFDEKFMYDNGDRRVRMFKYERAKIITSEPDITVIISAFNRPELLQDQVTALQNQTLKPKEIIVWLTRLEEYKNDKRVEKHFDIPEGVTLVKAYKDLTLPARFAATQFAKTPYVLLIDDDVFPAEGYLEETLKICKREKAVLSAYGIVYKNKDFNDINSPRYGDNGTPTEEPIEIDVGGHSWFGRKEWFSYFFHEPVASPTDGDDLHFSYILRKYTDVRLMVSAMPKDNPKIWANTKPDAGMGFKALHTRKREDERFWTSPTQKQWTANDNNYLHNNFREFLERRKKVLELYHSKYGWRTLEEGIKKSKNITTLKTTKGLEVSVDIPTKGRYHSTLPMTLLSVMMQTYPVKKIFLVDDTDPDKDGKMYDLRTDPMYQYFFSMIAKKGIEWEVIYGARKGQHYSHQVVLDRSTTPFILRIDDDIFLEPQALENMISKMKDGVGCVGGLVLDPKFSQKVGSEYTNTNKLSDINIRENTQWVKHPEGRTFEVEHLYSSFLYRKTDNIKYCLELSNVAHREETIFSHEYFRNGYKLLVTTDSISWHFRNPKGGIRTQSDPKLWEHDEKIFQRKLQSWSIKPNGKIFQIDSGIGDTICFMKILPQLIEKYGKVMVGTYYGRLFKNYPVEILHPHQVKDILGDKIADTQNIYRYLWQESDKGRKLHIIDAYKELFLEQKID
jgi:FkbM family methyltransferase